MDLLQYVGRASTNFVVDLVHVIGFQRLELIAPAIFVYKNPAIVAGLKRA